MNKQDSAIANVRLDQGESGTRRTYDQAEVDTLIKAAEEATIKETAAFLDNVSDTTLGEYELSHKTGALVRHDAELRGRTLEEAALILDNGRFLTEDSLERKWARQIAALIRALKEQTP